MSQDKLATNTPLPAHYLRQPQETANSGLLTGNPLQTATLKKGDSTAKDEPLRAWVDPKSVFLLVFNRPVTLEEAKAYLFVSPPKKARAIVPELISAVGDGRFSRFMFDAEDLDLAYTLKPAHLHKFYTSTKPAGIPDEPKRATLEAEVARYPWLTAEARIAILEGKLKVGINEFEGPSPGGKIIVLRSGAGPAYTIDSYQEYPEEIAFYLEMTEGDEKIAGFLLELYTRFNRDLRALVEEGVRPELAKSKLWRRYKFEAAGELVDSLDLFIGAADLLKLSSIISRWLSERHPVKAVRGFLSKFWKFARSKGGGMRPAVAGAGRGGLPSGSAPTGKHPAFEAPTETHPIGEAPTGKHPAFEAPTRPHPVGEAPTEPRPFGKAPTEPHPTGKPPTERYGERLPFKGLGTGATAPPLPTSGGVVPLPEGHWRHFVDTSAKTLRPDLVWPGWKMNYAVDYREYIGHWRLATG